MPKLTEFEQQREARIAANRAKIASIGLVSTAQGLKSLMSTDKKKPAQSQPRVRKAPVHRKPAVRRASHRLRGERALNLQIGDNDMLIANGVQVDISDSSSDEEEYTPVDLLDRDTPTDELTEQQLQKIKHASDARGVLDQKNGITCHFCRQKTVCTEPNCPHCKLHQRTSDTGHHTCLGKTSCSRCMSHTGHFCRACLLLRYGKTLEDARQEMEAGTWLCPHCHEADHPEEGWICNSSICMTRRGLKPTGIAIFSALAHGHSSVAHLVQARVKHLGVEVLSYAKEAMHAYNRGLTAPARPASLASGKQTSTAAAAAGGSTEAAPEALEQTAVAGGDGDRLEVAAVPSEAVGEKRSRPAGGAGEQVEAGDELDVPLAQRRRVRRAQQEQQREAELQEQEQPELVVARVHVETAVPAGKQQPAPDGGKRGGRQPAAVHKQAAPARAGRKAGGGVDQAAAAPESAAQAAATTEDASKVRGRQSKATKQVILMATPVPRASARLKAAAPTPAAGTGRKPLAA